MTADAVLRPVAEADIQACFDLDQRCFPPDIAFAQELFGELGESAEAFLVAEQDGLLVGFVAAIMDEKDRTSVIVTLDVEPERRRQGLGHRLLSAAHRLLEKRGADTVFLHVSPENDAARRLYDKHDYVTISRFSDYYGPQRDALLMMRTLEIGDH